MDWCAQLGFRDIDVPGAVGGVDARLRVHVGGTGPALVLVHGNPTHGFLWRKVLPGLADHFECHVIDLAGFGGSWCSAPLGVGRQAHIVAQVIGRLVAAHDRVTWLAHDWGCAVALHATRLLPDRQHAVAFTEGHVRWLLPWNALDPGFTGLFSRLREPKFGEDFVVRRNAFIEDVLLGSLPHLTAAERDSYRQPFADAGRRRHPRVGS